MAYARIRRVSEEDKALASPELAALRQVWLERKQHVAARGSLDRFLLELKREWAIETGRAQDANMGIEIALESRERAVEQAVELAGPGAEARRGLGPEPHLRAPGRDVAACESRDAGLNEL
jgi:hypothetical protein